MSKGVENLLDNYLCINNDEGIALIYDSARSPTAECLRSIASSRGLNLHSIEIEWAGKGRLDPKAAEFLASPEYPVVIISVVRSIWHTDERRRAKYDLKKRVVSIVSPLEYLSDGPVLADVASLKSGGEKIRNALKPGALVEINSPSGTQVEARVGRIFMEDGDYSSPGSGGNFP